MQDEKLFSVCPLLLPQCKDGLTYDGFIEINGQTFRLSIVRPNLESLKGASVSCSWRLWNILHHYQDVIKQRLHQSESLESFIVEFKNLAENLVKCKEDDIGMQSLPLDTYSLLTNELEHIGWDKLVFINESFDVIKLRTSDTKGREHILTVHIPSKYPQVVPKCTADVPATFHFKGSSTAEDNMLESIYNEFSKVVLSYDVFWNVMDEIDQNCWILEPENPTRADASRRIALGNNTSLLVRINVQHPTTMPECHLMGADSVVMKLRENMNKNLDQWDPGRSVLVNLENLLEAKFPSRQTSQKEDFSQECGICYAYRLDNAIPESACDDPRCGKPFHTNCLYEWLRSLPSSRQSFNIIFGECPYCNKPITVKVK
ncbi:E3 ubiquitin-protein ligase FANCL-like [Dendronephthya gigantea]|uniref:E3 ubiquitin-protein ligase FANCL-like n=1 Tax=Dendronephthya gigantea TaxID=151771 RepID=UPI00106C5B05|nr:E3 ubiquitin-protein ligase FANCL-like [Dendronephthya gigantea]